MSFQLSGDRGFQPESGSRSIPRSFIPDGSMNGWRYPKSRIYESFIIKRFFKGMKYSRYGENREKIQVHGRKKIGCSGPAASKFSVVFWGPEHLTDRYMDATHCYGLVGLSTHKLSFSTRGCRVCRANSNISPAPICRCPG